MAAEVLQAILTEILIKHEPWHNIESFIYILAYSLTRRVILKSQPLDEDTRKKCHLFFYSTFGQMKLDDIWTSRRGQGPLTVSICFPTLVSTLMAELLRILEAWGWSGIPNRSHACMCYVSWTRQSGVDRGNGLMNLLYVLYIIYLPLIYPYTSFIHLGQTILVLATLQLSVIYLSNRTSLNNHRYPL